MKLSRPWEGNRRINKFYWNKNLLLGLNLKDAKDLLCLFISSNIPSWEEYTEEYCEPLLKSIFWFFLSKQWTAVSIPLDWENWGPQVVSRQWDRGRELANNHCQILFSELFFRFYQLYKDHKPCWFSLYIIILFIESKFNIFS